MAPATRAHKGQKRRHSSSAAAAAETATGFLRLPREVRDQIYQLALVADHSIEVLHVDWTQVKGSWTAVPKKNATADSTKNIAVHLLTTNRTIHAEAAPIFYGSNVFSFFGKHDWRDEIEWLTSIGAANRTYLTVLETTFRQPSYAYQYKDGSRQAVGDEYIPAGPRPRNPLIQLPPSGYGRTADGQWQEGAVMDVDPKWEQVFRLLGDDAAAAPKLTLRVLNGATGIPGVMGIVDDESGDETWCSMDIANVLEVWRAEHSATKSAKNRDIDVIWRCSRGYVDTLDGFWERFRKAGWDVVKDSAWPPTDPKGTAAGAQDSPEGPQEVTMRRRHITGPIYADGPNPYGGDSWNPLAEE